MKSIVLALLFLSVCFGDSLSLQLPTERKPEKGTIITGSCLLGTTWAIAALAAIATASESKSSDAYLAIIPVAGPIILMYSEGGPHGSPLGIVPWGMTIAEALGVVLIVKGAIGSKQMVINPTINNNRNGIQFTVYY
jgi:hypothetical protein